MNLLNKYKKLVQEAEKSTLYGAGKAYSARVVHKDGKHTVKFFHKGTYLQDADYDGKNLDDAHEFAYHEMQYRQGQLDDQMEIRKRTSTDEAIKKVDERILEPQGHLESADHISDDSKKNGVGPKKQMGNHTPLDIIAKILSGKK